MAKKKALPKGEVVYSVDMAARICDLVAGGKSLKEITLLDGMPGRTTIYKWLGTQDDFANMYARAREERAELVADEVISIADTEEDPNRARVRIDARKWWAAKVNPRKYGDKAELNVNADHKHHHSAEPLSESAHWLAKLLGGGSDSEAEAPLQNGSVLPS